MSTSADTCERVNAQITTLVMQRPVGRRWLLGLGVAFLLLNLLLVCIAWLLIKGVGIWGVNIPVGWGFAITNFVWWIGIGHAGTFISAILLLLHQNWRTSINRFAESMTLFAVACAGLFPLLHLGRPQLFYWLLPYPDTMGLWPQWRSPLVWDVFAVSTYLTVSLLFWFIGLLPDLATLRDQQQRPLWQRRLYGLLALGWRNSARHWQRYESAYILLAGLATPLVISVHSVVSFDFAVGIVPGWHSTIFPPYFVAGAIFSGFAMVLTLIIPVRRWYGLEGYITPRHLENCAKVMFASGLILAYGYFSEWFTAWYSDDKVEAAGVMDRFFGHYAPAAWLMLGCNILVPQLLWFRAVRTSAAMLFVVSLLVNVGMWTERYVIVVGSLSHDFMPSAWGQFHPTFWDWGTYAGTIGLFLTLLFLFVRVLPMIAVSEMRKQEVAE
ncbi:NrfD/PsrC family molybdoenzyme membrane anchor subunit [Prosthecobacter sp.]|uniref:NrfD/PsrC family molybdoenzyme membrane anchor subunit n=1 Tax=Prosthecobacter sp. TaxID=1965333 RepID=UPI00378515E7